MIYVVTAVGVLMCAAALAGLLVPRSLAAFASRVAGSRSMRYAAIGARIAFGAIAIIVAEQTLYPWPMKIIGVVSIMAGTVVAMIGQDVLNRWVEQTKQGSIRMRALSLVALAVGAFLVHASV